MTIESILQQYDKVSRKGFDEQDVDKTIQDALKGKQELSTELRAESMAFAFVEDYPDKDTAWGTYFGPMAIWPDGNGSLYESPSLSLVTPEMLDYYTKRANSCSNPILISRYAGLVYDFHLKVCNKKPGFQIASLYIRSLLDSVNGNYTPENRGVVKKLKRALELSTSLGNSQWIEKSKDAILGYDRIGGSGDSLVLWKYAFKWLIGNKKVKLSQDEEQLIISNLEARLSHCISEQDITKFSPHSAERAGEPLAEYYFKNKAPKDLERVLLAIEEAYERIRPRARALQMDHHLRRCYELYTRFQLNAHAEKVLIKIRELGPGKKAEMGTIPYEFSIPADDIRGLAGLLLNGDSVQALEQVAAYFVPSKKQSEKEMQDAAKISPLSHLFRTQIQDNEGRTVTELNRIEEDPEGHLVHHISQGIKFSSAYLLPVLQIGMENGKISSESVLSYLSKTPVIKPVRHAIIQQALECFFNQQYIVFLHLVIPQIEDTLRNIVEKNNGNVLKATRSGGHQLRTFDDILREQALKKVLGEDMATYFRVLFTDQRGWNLRNTICHGMADPQYFNAIHAAWVLHSLLCIGLIRPVKSE